MSEPYDPRHGYNPDMVARSEKVEIDAPAAIVWEVLTDLPRYGEWNPFCVKAVSTLKIGDPIEMTVTNHWSDETFPVTEYVCTYDEPRQLSWRMNWTEQWPYAGIRDQYIEDLGPERCAYNTTDAFLGETAIHIMRFANGYIEAGFNDMARALKKRAEAIHAERKVAR